MIKQGNVYYYSKDGLGSTVNLTDNTGTIAESYTYDEYGNVSAPSQVGNRYLYTSREYDPEINLYYYRARYYDPSIGRFLQTDPIGYQGGINLYGYVGNNPINYIDPEGLEAKKKKGDKKGGGIGIGVGGGTGSGGGKKGPPPQQDQNIAKQKSKNERKEKPKPAPNNPTPTPEDIGIPDSGALRPGGPRNEGPSDDVPPLDGHNTITPNPGMTAAIAAAAWWYATTVAPWTPFPDPY